MSEPERLARMAEIEAIADEPMPMEEALKLGAEYLELEAREIDIETDPDAMLSASLERQLSMDFLLGKKRKE